MSKNVYVSIGFGANRVWAQIENEYGDVIHEEYSDEIPFGDEDERNHQAYKAYDAAIEWIAKNGFKIVEDVEIEPQEIEPYDDITENSRKKINDDFI